MRTRVSVYGLAERDDAVLLVQLAPFCYRGGSWSLPGGGMEHGEQPLDTLKRELHEETALAGRHPRLHATSSYSEDGKHGLYMAVQIVFTVEMEGEPRVLEENGSTASVRWVPRSELEHLSLVPWVADLLS